MSKERHVSGTGHIVQIGITASGSPDNPQWDCKWKHWDKDTNTFTFDKKDFPGMAAEDYHLLEFMLTDNTGGGLHFPKRPDDAMWVMGVAPGSQPKCPDKDDSCDYSIFRPLARLAPNRYLVMNLNPAIEKWTFTLNFVKQGCSETDRDGFIPFDPIGDNKDAASLA